MTKREIIKTARQKILKGSLSHQEVYSELKTGNPITDKRIAEALKLVPSKRIIKKYQGINIVFIVLMSLNILLGLIGLIAFFMMVSNIPYILPYVFAALMVIGLPLFGLIGAIKHIKWMYYVTASILLVYFTILLMDVYFLNGATAVMLILTLAEIIFGFLVPSKLVTPYKKKITDYFEDGQRKAHVSFEFDMDHENTNRTPDAEILDDQL